MKVSVEKIKIEMTSNESEMLLVVLRSVDWKTFSTDISTDKMVVEGYNSFVDEFIEMVSREIR